MLSCMFVSAIAGGLIRLSHGPRSLCHRCSHWLTGGLWPQLRAATAALDELRKVHHCALYSAAAAAAQLREAQEAEWDSLKSRIRCVGRSGGTRHSL